MHIFYSIDWKMTKHAYWKTIRELYEMQKALASPQRKKLLNYLQLYQIQGIAKSWQMRILESQVALDEYHVIVKPYSKLH